MKYPIGHKFTVKNRKYQREYTVINFHTTTNLEGKVVKERYVTTHEFMGQTITTHDTVQTTIDRAGGYQ